MERLNACQYSHCTEPEVKTEEPDEQERRKSGKWHVATGHAQLRIVNHAYTARCSYNTLLFADPDCCTRTYVYILSQSFMFKYVKSHWYPKSTIDIQSLWLLSLQAALRALKRLKKLSIFPTEPKGSQLLKHWKGAELHYSGNGREPKYDL